MENGQKRQILSVFRKKKYLSGQKFFLKFLSHIGTTSFNDNLKFHGNQRLSKCSKAESLVQSLVKRIFLTVFLGFEYLPIIFLKNFLHKS